MRLITWLWNSLLFPIHIELRKETRDWLNQMRGSYYNWLKGLRPYLFYSSYSISKLYQTVLCFIQYLYYSQTILCFILHKKIPWTYYIYVYLWNADATCKSFVTCENCENIRCKSLFLSTLSSSAWWIRVVRNAIWKQRINF